MFQKRPTNQPDTSNDEVNAFIIGDDTPSLDAGISSPDPLSLTDENIIDADFHQADARKPPLNKSKIAILVAVALFGVGGIASIFLQPDAQAPVAQAEQAPPVAAPVVSPAPDIALPPGLAPATLPGAAPAEPTPAPNASADSQAPTVAPAAAPVATTQSPVVPVATVPDPSAKSPVSEPAAPAIQASPAKIANPIAAQVAEAQGAKQAPPKVAAPQETVAPAPVKASPVPAKAAPSTQKPAPAKVAPADDHEHKPAAAPVSASNNRTVVKKIVPLAKEAEPTPFSDDGHEGIKRLISTSAEAMNLQSIQDGAITLDQRRGNAPQRLQAGDRLPSGEQIVKIDAQSMTIVTDRSVIRLK